VQCKDIPDLPILRLLKSLNGKWANWFDGREWDGSNGEHLSNSVLRAMPTETNGKLALAKMRQLMKRGLVKGCPCGCRGDFEITQLGEKHLANSGNLT
jgi:hypothetical protein